jgi:uncharacterized protein YcbK (DUF882 family)
VIITPHFALSEFACRDHTAYPLEWVQDRLRPLCETLEVVREAAGGRSLRVISGFRSEAYNRRIGGAKLSRHVSGEAGDMQHAVLTAEQLHELVLALKKAGKLPHLGALGLYPTFCHLDVRPIPDGRLRRWTGSRVGG